MDDVKFKKNLLNKIEQYRKKINLIKEISEELEVNYEDNNLYIILESRKNLLAKILLELSSTTEQ